MNEDYRRVVFVGNAEDFITPFLQKDSRSIPPHAGYTTEHFAYRRWISSLESKEFTFVSSYDTHIVVFDGDNQKNMHLPREIIMNHKSF